MKRNIAKSKIEFGINEYGPEHVQDQPQRTLSFEPLCGTGTLRAKNAQDAQIRTGQISLPRIGQCFIDGIHGYSVPSATLDVKRADTREVVAKLVIPVSRDHVVQGLIIVGEGASRETWKVVATLRKGASGPYRALRLPDVQIAPDQKRTAFGGSKYAAV